MKRKVLLLAGWLLVFLWAVVTPVGGDSAGKILSYALFHEHPLGLDPVDAQYINIQPLFCAVYATLYRLDNNMRPYPLLVEKTERQGDAVIFEIKNGAKFSDGSDITAADVVASLEAGMTRRNYPNPIYKVIAGGEEFANGAGAHCKGITLLGPKKFQILFTEPNCQFENYFASTIMSILPQKRNRGEAGWAFSGYFLVEKIETKTNRSVVTLRRNRFYSGKPVKIEAIRMEFWSNHDEFERSIYKGEPDLFLYNRGQKMPRSGYKYNYFKTPNFGAFYLQLNPRKGPFSDKRLRQFMKCFMVSGDFLRELDYRLFSPTFLVLPYSLSGYSVFQPIVPCEFESLKPEKRVKIRCVNVHSGIRPSLMDLIQKRLKKYNVDLELAWDSLANINKMKIEGTVDMSSLYYMTDVPLSYYFYETMFIPGQELNLFHYENAEAAHLLAQYRRETAELKRLKTLARLEEIAQEEAYLIPIGVSLSLLGYKNSIENVSIDKFLNVNFEEMDVQKRH